MDRKLWLLVVIVGVVVYAYLHTTGPAADAVDAVFDAAEGLRSIVVHRSDAPSGPEGTGDFPGG